VAQHYVLDKAAHLMSCMPFDRAARDMGGAVDYLLGHDAVAGNAVGAIGFCMGGAMTLLVSALQGDKIRAAVPFYGAPLGDQAPEWGGLTATVRGHFAENDDFFGPEPVKALEAELQAMGKDVVLEVHPGTGHAFLNEDNPLGTYNPDAAKKAWDASVAFLRAELG
jgi:carboxymethylenebutenolidase